VLSEPSQVDCASCGVAGFRQKIRLGHWELMSGRISAIVQLINPGVTGRGRMGDRARIQGQSPVFLLGMSGIALVAGSKIDGRGGFGV